MRRLAIVQARFGSSRLPGKVMLTLDGRSVLAEVLRRCLSIPGIDGVCCAIAEGFAADMLAHEARSVGAEAFIGPEQDVLARYLGAARQFKAGEILRVTSDCPLIDPDVCAAVLDRRRDTDADYVANNFAPGFPHGLDCEAFTMEALERSAALAVAPYDREHVTPLLRRSGDFRQEALQAADARFADFRWTLDYPEDYAFFHAVFRMLGDDRPGWIELAERLAATDLPAINEGRSAAARAGLEPREKGR